MPLIIEKIDKVMDTVERNCVGFATLGMVAIIFTNVVMRNFFHSGLVWGNELTSYLNIFAVYIAISAGFKYGSHVGVSVFVDFVLPKKIRKSVSVITQFIILLFCMLVSYLAVKMSMAQFASGQVSPVLTVPLWIIYGIVVIGMIMSSLRIIMVIIKIINKRETLSQGGEASC